MKQTRRRFLEAAGAGVAAAGVPRWFGCSTPPPPVAPLTGAPDVDLLAAMPDYSHDLERYLVRLSNEARGRRKQAVAAITSRQQLLDRQKYLVQQFWSMLGGPFERTPLNPKVTGVVEQQGYRIEKVAFESRPRLYVAANLYVPAGIASGTRRPGILGPLGHSANGKAWHSYQKLFANLARKGYVVLAYDPFGQGERIEYPGPHPGQSALGGGTSEHEHAGRRLILLGANMGLFRAWDGIRGIDYLLSRPEVDPERLGCCGQSGGGTMTQFLAALDERLRAAVVSEGNTENLAQENVEPPGSADDAEQNIVPALDRGIDRADLLQVFAPRPLLMTVTLHDAGNTYSPEYVANSIEMLEELKRSYALLGAADSVALQATTEAHGYGYEMRRATYRWFNQWFNMQDAGDDEASQATEADQTLFVTPTGFVTTSFGGETALSLTRQMATAIPTPAPLGAPEVRKRVRGVLGVPEVRAELRARVLSRVRKPGYRAEQFEFTSEGEVRIPGWLLIPDKATASSPAVLYLGEAAAWNSVAEEAFAEQLCARGGCRVAVIDVRGRGEGQIAYPPRGRHYFPSRIPNEAYLAWFALMLGKPLPGGQVLDALRAAEYLRSRPEIGGGAIWVMGDGPHGVLALYAAALDEGLRGAVVRQTVTDYRSLATADRYTQPFGIYLYNVLREFDLPQVAGAIGPRPVLMLDPAGPQGEPASDRARTLYKDASNVSVRVVAEKEDPVALVAGWVASSQTSRGV